MTRGTEPDDRFERWNQRIAIALLAALGVLLAMVVVSGVLESGVFQIIRNMRD